MKKELKMVITGCKGCPFFEYDSHYSMSRNSGWDCNHSDVESPSREHHLPDDVIGKREKEIKEWDLQNTTLFKPMGKRPITAEEEFFLKSCPLKEIEE